MKRHKYLAGLAFLALIGMAEPTTAQRGVGDTVGVAQQAAQVEITPITGTLDAVEIGPCPATLGRSIQGMHLKIATVEGKTLNIHLGPAQELKKLADVLVVGQPVTVAAFQTATVKNEQYIAQSVTVAGNTYVLRNSNLRPEWAGGRGRGAGMGRGGAGMGAGYGGNGRGRGYCRGPSEGTPENLSDATPQGWGRGQARGRGFQGAAQAGAQNGDEAQPGYGQGGGQGGGRGRGRGPRG
jgi:hypothetical protein